MQNKLKSYRCISLRLMHQPRWVAWLVIAVTLMILTVTMSACNAAEADNEAQGGPHSVTLSVWGATDLHIDLNNSEETWYDVNSLTTLYPITVSAGDYSDYTIKVNGIELNSNSEVVFFVEKLNHDVGIPIEITNQETGLSCTKYIRTLNPAIDVRSFGESDGYYYFTRDSFRCKMNGSGEVVYYGISLVTYDFKPHQVGDKLYYTFIYGTGAFDVTDVKCALAVLDDKFAMVDQVEYLNTEKGMPERQRLDMHDAMMLDVGHYIITSYVPKRVTNIPQSVPSYSPFGSRVLAAVVQEIKDGELLFQWDSTEHPELYGLSEQNNEYTNSMRYFEDYAHINSIEIDPSDNNLILSLRNMSTVLKVSRTTGEILWKLGGSGDDFGLDDSQKFSAQHYARISSRGTLTVFDNGMVMPEGEPNPFVDEYKTRIVKYGLDEESHQLVSFKEYVVPGTCSPIMGNAELLDPTTDTFMIGWGGRRAGTPLFSLVNFKENKVVFEVFDKGSNITQGSSYRAYKSDF